ncbi:condensation domain-containing protein [Planomonospora sp. ID67723]|uniref:condensation domain-containing protein n=1 Tax=Planomonospora sp. ID67723 TaxID=2738134 RepID=UPI0018C440C6|nr:condensation domain-containing protein [Planomonospora sp. ID67723]
MHPSITSQYLDRFRGLGEEAKELLPVTGAQRRFLLLRRLDRRSRPDLVPLFFAFPRGAVDTRRLVAAANHLAATHPVLRARPEVVRGTPVLRTHDPAVPVDRVQVRHDEDPAEALRRALSAWSTQGAPLRLLLAEGAQEETLAVVMDHVACDEQSIGRILGELSDAYQAGHDAADVPPHRVREEVQAYREAVRMQLDAEARASTPAAAAYWGTRLAGLRPAAPAAPAAGPAGTIQRRLPASVVESRAGAFPALLRACSAAARLLYGEDRVSPLGYPWGGRPLAAPPVLGCFLNTVAFPADACNDPAAAWWDDLDHADVPFDEVVRAARASGAPWQGDLDGLLTFEDLHRRPPLLLGTTEGREVHIDGRPVRAPFAVSVSYGADLLIRMTWNRQALSDETAGEAFAELVEVVLHS